MKIVKIELGDGKTLVWGTVLLDGFAETGFKLIDGQYGPWLIIGRSLQNKDGEWKNGIFSLKNEAYKDASEQVEEAWRELISERGKELEGKTKTEASLKNDLDTIAPADQVFTSEDIPF